LTKVGTIFVNHVCRVRCSLINFDSLILYSCVFFVIYHHRDDKISTIHQILFLLWDRSFVSTLLNSMMIQDAWSKNWWSS
jgi:hypothetical protein